MRLLLLTECACVRACIHVELLCKNKMICFSAWLEEKTGKTYETINERWSVSLGDVGVQLRVARIRYCI